MSACRRQYPGRTDGAIRSYSPSTSAFPRFSAGQLLPHPFRGLHSVHDCYGLQTRQVAYATLYTRGFSSFVTSTTAPIATGWSEPVPGRDFPTVDQRLFTAHAKDRLGSPADSRAQIGRLRDTGPFLS